VRTLLAVLALTFTLAACGGGDDEVTSGGASEKPEASGEETSATETVIGVQPACDLAGEADVEAAYGEPVPPGSAGGGSHSENDVEWETDNCKWEAEDGLDIRLGVSVAEDYPDGQLICPELHSFDTAATPVPELGDGATWVIDELDANEGTLRVCLDEVNFDLDVESSDGSRDPNTLRDQSVALAGVVLAHLG
jgi:hypothetical protein